jgi:hypothetical protein
MVELTSLKTLTEKLNSSFALDFINKETDSSMLRLKTFQTVIDNMDNYVAVVTPDLKLSMINKKMRKMLKDRLNLDVCIGQEAYHQLYGFDKPPEWDPFLPAIKHKRVTIREFISPTTKRKYGIIAIPMIYNGVSAVVGIATDEDEL